MDRAYAVVSSSSPTERNIFSPDRESSWLDLYRCARAVKLGLGEEAVAIYGEVLARTDPSLSWERVAALSQMATGWVLRGELELAASTLAEAVSLARATGNQARVAMALWIRQRS